MASEGPLEEVPVCFFAFDLLAVGNDDITAHTYAERREALRGLSLNRPRPLVIPPYWTTSILPTCSLRSTTTVSKIS